MLLRLEVLPLALHLVVHLQFGIAFGIFEAKLLINGNQVGKEQCVHALALIIGPHGHKQQIEYLRALPHERFQHMEPSEGQQPAFGLLQGTRERCH